MAFCVKVQRRQICRQPCRLRAAVQRALLQRAVAGEGLISTNGSVWEFLATSCICFTPSAAASWLTGDWQAFSPAGEQGLARHTGRQALTPPFAAIGVHAQAVTLFSQPGIGNLDFELRHKAIIDRFGHYPHRNAILGRSSSAEELAFLAEQTPRCVQGV